jgi:hypothetical protein
MGAPERQFLFYSGIEFEKHILAALGYSLKWRSQQTNYLFSLLVLSDFDELSLAELSLFVFPSFFQAESPFDALAPPDFLA